MIQLQGEFGERVSRRLEKDWIIWLTTVDRRGIPQPRPVWFYWDGEFFLIFSRPGTAKVRHIQANPQVALNLDSDGRGGDIMVFTGPAVILKPPEAQHLLRPFQDKYVDGLKRIQMTAEAFFTSYSTAIRVQPHKIRGH
jgi:PPOX class probable F420-dependent enzyme